VKYSYGGDEDYGFLNLLKLLAGFAGMVWADIMIVVGVIKSFYEEKFMALRYRLDVEGPEPSHPDTYVIYAERSDGKSVRMEVSCPDVVEDIENAFKLLNPQLRNKVPSV
jgi:hypothetical protein